MSDCVSCCAPQKWLLAVLRGADGEHEGRAEHGADGAVQQAVEDDDAEGEGHVPETLRTGQAPGKERQKRVGVSKVVAIHIARA